MKIRVNPSLNMTTHNQVSFSGYGCKTPELLEKIALRKDAQAFKNSEELYPVVDKLSENLIAIKQYFLENNLVFGSIKKEQKKNAEPNFWVMMMPENSILKDLNANGYKKEDFIARSFSALSGDSEIFFENVMKKAKNMQKSIENALESNKI